MPDTSTFVLSDRGHIRGCDWSSEAVGLIEGVEWTSDNNSLLNRSEHWLKDDR